LTFNGLKTV